MKSLKIIGLSALIIVFLIGYYFSNSESVYEKIEKDISFNIDDSLFEYSYYGFDGVDSAYLNACLELYNKINPEKKLESFKINSPIDDKAINLYFIDTFPDNRLIEFKENCASIGHRNIIICDLNFIKKQQNLLSGERQLIEYDKWVANNPDQAEIDDELGDLNRYMIQMGIAVNQNNILWIIGHEIGHLALNHKKGHFISSTTTNEENSQIQRNEVEADNFSVEVMKDIGLGHQFYLGLAQLIQRLISAELNIQHPDKIQKYMEGGSPIFLKDTLILNNKGTHPHMLYRALKTQLYILEKELTIDNTGYYENIDSLIQIVN